MRFQTISLRQVSVKLEVPFELLELTEIDEYTCFLYRCEGEVPLHRHLDHDELLWPQDRPIYLTSEREERRIEAGDMVRIVRGWKHRSKASHASYVLLISRGKRVLSLNGYYRIPPPTPPQVICLEEELIPFAINIPQPLTSCDTLHLYIEHVTGTGPSRRATNDILITPTKGNVGLRCGGIVVIIEEMELARIPAGCGWHLFGEANVVWMTPLTEGVTR